MKDVWGAWCRQRSGTLPVWTCRVLDRRPFRVAGVSRWNLARRRVALVQGCSLPGRMRQEILNILRICDCECPCLIDGKL